MGFLVPGFLAGLFALGIPVYFHLLKKHKTTPVPFSSLMFFERRTQSSIKHRRLQYLLLFALRMAFLLLLALAFAHPYIKSSAIAAAHGGRQLALCVDNSFSMRQGDRLARAKSAAMDTLASMRAGDHAEVITFGGPIQLLTDMTNDATALRTAVQSIEQSDGTSSYAELSHSLISVAKSTHGPIEAHVFSDMQRSSLPASFADLRLADGIKLVPHPAATQIIPNFTVETVLAPRRIYDPKRVRVQVTVAGFDTLPDTRRVSLLLNNKLVESKEVQVPAGGRGTVEFLSLDAPYGFSKGEARIDSADTFPADDHFYFSVERSDPRPALFVHDARDTRSQLYFRTALESGTEPAFTIEAATSDQTANLSPAKYAFIVLSDTGNLPAKFEDSLKNYVKGGGSLLIALGKNSAGMRRVPVIDLPLSGLQYAAPEGDRFEAAGYLDATHPSIRRATKWDDVKFYQVIAVQPRDARVAGRLTDNSPLLIDKKFGEGRVVVFASAFDNVANDLPLHAAFVPFIEQTAHYLGGIGDAPANYAVGAYIDLRSAKEQGAPVEVLGPKGERALSLSEATKAQNLQLTREGFYDIRRGSGKHELAAVNPDRKESNFELVPAETLKLWENTGQPVPGTAGAPETTKKPNDIWWYVMICALALAVAESVLGNRHLSMDREAA